MKTGGNMVRINETAETRMAVHTHTHNNLLKKIERMNI